jgi:5-methyltetrahydropteroyltriglutamate--homocysteine methyltransferase
LRAGITVIGDGEQTRQHFVTTFIEHLEGVDFVNRKTVRIRDRYDAEVPMVVGPVSRKRPVFVEDARRLRLLTDRPIKFTLPGPMTMIDTLYDDHFKSRAETGLGLCRDSQSRRRTSCRGGRRHRPVRRAGLQRVFRRGPRLGRAALERAAAGLSCKTAVHICYGYGIEANIKWKEGLGEEWRQYEQTFPAATPRADQPGQSLECAQLARADRTDRLLADKEVLVGAIDVASNRIETPEEVAATLRKALQWVKPQRIRLHQLRHGALAARRRRGKLRALGEGAALARRSF